MPEVFGNRKKFHTHDLLEIHPKNENQERYLSALYSEIPIVLGLGWAGTGKSSLALHSSLYQVFDGRYDKIHIIRNIVESGERIGFLPGDIEQKLEPYESPYKQLCQDFLNFVEPYDILKDLGQIEFHPPNFLRGTTLEGIIIIEEAQNFDYLTLRDIISRAGHNTKIIINGDVRQDDLVKIKKKSGLAKLVDVLDLMPYGDVAKIEFELEDIVRSDVVKNFLIADYDYEQNEGPR